MPRQALTLIAVVAIFGVAVPWYKGLTVLQPLVVLAYALMALLFVAPAASEFWSTIELPPAFHVVLLRMLAIVGYGWGIALAMLITALITLNLVYRSDRLLIPPEPFLGAVLLLSLTASAAVGVVCALLGRRFSAPTAKALIRAIFLLTLFGLAFGSRILPESWQIELVDHTTRRAITTLAWEGSIACAVISFLGMIFMLRSSPAPAEPAVG